MESIAVSKARSLNRVVARFCPVWCSWGAVCPDRNTNRATSRLRLGRRGPCRSGEALFLSGANCVVNGTADFRRMSKKVAARQKPRALSDKELRQAKKSSVGGNTEN
jgi:hypothetical protein